MTASGHGQFVFRLLVRIYLFIYLSVSIALAYSQLSRDFELT